MIKSCIYILMLLCLYATVNAQTSETDSLLKVLQTAKEDTNKVNLLRNIGVTYANEDPARAIEYWKQGIALSRKLNFTVGLARNFINIGTGYSYLNKFDSTIIYADSGILYSKKTNNLERIALAYLNKGDGYRNLGDFKSALLYCDTASMYAVQTTNTDRQARIYDIISGIYLEQRQFENALIFSNKAMQLYKKDNNIAMQGQVYDDIGILYQQTGKLDSALIYRKMAIRIGESIKDFKNLSTYYYGVASVYMDQKKYKEAETNATKSIVYARQQENNGQLAISYTLLGTIFNKQKKYSDAIKAGERAYQFALSEVQIAAQQESAALLAEAYSGTGDYKNASHFLEISGELKDSLTRQIFNGQVAGLQSSFELKEKDKAIQLLNKDNELQQQKLEQQYLVMIAAIAIALLALVGVWLLLTRNKLRQHMKELELRGKIAADLHDEVGSTLSSIRMYSNIVSIQVKDTSPQSTALLDKISTNSKEMIENMSDIVWMIKPGNDDFKSMENRILNFANELCAPAGINFNFNKDALIDAVQISMEQRRDIYLIFKEAVNNAVKYSDCHSIRASITLQNNQLQIRISDDGKGFDTNIASNGNGLSNMRKRAEINFGTFEINSSSGEGTEIIVSFKP